MMWNDSWVTGQWAAMMLMMLLVVAVAVALFVWLVRETGSADPGWAPRREPRSPEQILAERFARGEIDESEFARGMDVLADQPRS